MLYRAFRAARFDRATYRDVLRDQQAILNALGIVILAGIAYAVGQSSAVGEAAEQGLDAGAIGDRLLDAWFASVTFMVGWLIWAGIAYGVGRIFLSGGGACMPGMAESLAERVQVETRLVNPFERVPLREGARGRRIVASAAPMMFLSVGLALRAA